MPNPVIVAGDRDDAALLKNRGNLEIRVFEKCLKTVEKTFKPVTLVVRNPLPETLSTGERVSTTRRVSPSTRHTRDDVVPLK